MDSLDAVSEDVISANEIKEILPISTEYLCV